MAADKQEIRQIAHSLSSDEHTLVHPKALSRERADHDLQILRHAVVEAADGQKFSLHSRFSPYTMYLPPSFIRELQSLDGALAKALNNIVQRWFSDKSARLPERMPVHAHEEDLLKWLDSSHDNPFLGRQGVWRPDYLVESYRDSAGIEGQRIKIVEINARFPYNGTFMVGCLTRAIRSLGTEPSKLKEAMNPQEFWQSLVNLFDASRPLHIIKNEWPGVDVHHFASFYRKVTGQRVIWVKPSELCLRSRDGAEPELYHVATTSADGEMMSTANGDGHGVGERVYQCSVELYQHELVEMDQQTLRKVAQRCVNDFRSILLVHDKRMLGIVLEEVDGMVSSGALTSSEGHVLRSGIPQTLLPRTQALKDLLKRSERDASIKDMYMLKAIRGGQGHGHELGSEMSNGEWLEKVEKLCNAASVVEQTHAVQKVVEQVTYDICRQEHEGVVEQFHLIGAYYSVNGEYKAHGPARIGRKWLIHLNEQDKGLVMIAMTS